MHDLLNIVGDPSHWIAEAIMDATFALVFLWPARAWLRRHDERKHS